METTKSRKNTLFKKVVLRFKETDEKIENWVHHIIDMLEKVYQL